MRPLCLYSGGLDSTYLLHLLRELRIENAIACTVSMGGNEDLPGLSQVCAQLGVRWVNVERTSEFVREFVRPAIAAQAIYLGGYPINASLSRPCIARAAVEKARELGCNAILHTSTSSQNSLRRFNGAIRDLGFEGWYGSVFESNAISRTEKIARLTSAGLKQYSTRLHSMDENLWGRGIEAGDLDDPEAIQLPDSLFSQHPRAADASVSLQITFEAGVPMGLNGTQIGLPALIHEVRRVGETFRLGRYVGLEEIETGDKVQEVREMAAAAILLDAYRRLETACVSAESIRAKLGVEQLWVREAVEGRWFGVLREAADAFIQSIAQRVSGEVSYQLSDQDMDVVSVVARRPLYVRDRGPIESSSATGRTPPG
jgi:argininosuccinate synthase